MGVPKKKHTKRRTNNKRKAPGHGQAKVINLAKCSNCATMTKPHTICQNCGFYKGKKVLIKLAS